MAEDERFFGIYATHRQNGGLPNRIDLSKGVWTSGTFFTVKLTQSVNSNIQGKALIDDGTVVLQPDRDVSLQTSGKFKPAVLLGNADLRSFHPFSLEAGKSIIFKLGNEEVVVNNDREPQYKDSKELQ